MCPRTRARTAAHSVHACVRACPSDMRVALSAQAGGWKPEEHGVQQRTGICAPWRWCLCDTAGHSAHACPGPHRALIAAVRPVCAHGMSNPISYCHFARRPVPHPSYPQASKPAWHAAAPRVVVLRLHSKTTLAIATGMVTETMRLVMHRATTGQCLARGTPSAPRGEPPNASGHAAMTCWGAFYWVPQRVELCVQPRRRPSSRRKRGFPRPYGGVTASCPAGSLPGTRGMEASHGAAVLGK